MYPELNARLRKYILNLVYEPIIAKLQERLVGESPERLFLKEVLGPKSLPKLDRKAVAQYRGRIRKHVLFLIDDEETEQVIYDDFRTAVICMGNLVAKLEEASLEAKERDNRDALRRSLDEALGILKPRDRRIVGLRYGLSSGRISTLAEVGQLFDITPERVRQIEDEVVKKLQGLRTIGKLAALADSPALREYVQRPIFIRRRART
jgi:RNA polymerase sigma factor (sigma-70 family)